MYGHGSTEAQIAIIEDIPVKQEVINKKMYLGGTGYTYKTMLSNQGLERDDVWTTSYFNKTYKDVQLYYDKKCTKIKKEVYAFKNHLLKELEQLGNLKILMPVGNISLQILSGVQGIHNWRGSILEIDPRFTENHPEWKIIPTYSPRQINKKYSLRVYSFVDFKKACKFKDEELQAKSRKIIVNPSFTKAKQLLDYILKYKIRIATDIETMNKHKLIDCISFAINPEVGISIPFYDMSQQPYWKNLSERHTITKLVKKIINAPDIPKILQNGAYDFWVMGNLGYNPKGLEFDTMYAEHCMHCELPKDLGTLTSVYTNEPYHKFELKDSFQDLKKMTRPLEAEIKKIQSLIAKNSKKIDTRGRWIETTQEKKSTPKRAENLESWKEEIRCLREEVKRLKQNIIIKEEELIKAKESGKLEADIKRWEYNVKDSLVTFEIALAQEKLLKSMGLWTFYTKYYIKLFPVIYNISMKGIKVDEDRRLKVSERIKKGLEQAKQEIYAKVGYSFNTESPSQLAKVLYSTLKLPVQLKDGRTTTEAAALNKLYDKTNNSILKDILDVRTLEKLKGTYLDSKLENGKMRTQVVLAHTTSGRFALRKTPWDTGGNLQNIPSGKREVSPRVEQILQDKNIVKTCFIPDSDEYVFVEIDLSNADTWYVAFKSKDIVLMEALLDGKDTHKIVGSICFQKPETEITKIERTASKRIGHGYNYGVREKTMSKMTKLSLDLVTEMFDRLKKTRPAIPEYHKEVERSIIEDKCLVNAWGRIRMFYDRTPYMWKNNKKIATPSPVYRSGYSYIPQSSVVDTINNVVFKVQDANPGRDIIIATQTHDSLLFQVNIRKLEQNLKLLYDCFNIEQNPWGDVFTIPFDFSIGYNWGHLEDIPIANGEIDYTKEGAWTNIVDNIKNKQKVYYFSK